MLLSGRSAAQGYYHDFLSEINKFAAGGAHTTASTILDSAGNVSSSFTTTVVKLSDSSFRLLGQEDYQNGKERHFAVYAFNQQRQLLFWKDSISLLLADSQEDNFHSYSVNESRLFSPATGRKVEVGDTLTAETAFFSSSSDENKRRVTQQVVIAPYEPDDMVVSTEMGLTGIEGFYNGLNYRVLDGPCRYNVVDSLDGKVRVVRRLYYGSLNDGFPYVEEIRWYNADTVFLELRTVGKDKCLHALTRIKTKGGVLLGTSTWTGNNYFIEKRVKLDNHGLPTEVNLYRNGKLWRRSYRYTNLY